MIIVSDRKLLIPSGEKHIGFTGDNLVETRIFAINDKSIFHMEFRIDLQNTKETVIAQKNLSDDGETLFLTWSITSAVLKNTPVVEFQLRGFETDGEKIWHSEKSCFYVSTSVDVESEITEEQLSEFQVLEQKASLHSENSQRYCLEAQQYRNEVQDLAQQSLADYTEIRDNTYTKQETDILLDEKSNAGEVYKKSEVDGYILDVLGEVNSARNDFNREIGILRTTTETAIGAAMGNVYTKDQADTLLSSKADSDDVYTKDDIDTLLSKKRDNDDFTPIASADKAQETISLVGITTVETSDDENGWEITSNTLSATVNPLFSNGAIFHIDFQGNVNLEIDANAFEGVGLNPAEAGYVEIDGIKLTAENVSTSGCKYRYNGDITREIIIQAKYARYEFATFIKNIKIYSDGFMSGEQADKLDTLESQIGNIDSALDELLLSKADAEDVYTKDQADTLLLQKADNDDVYTKDDIDENLKNPSYEEEIKLTEVTTATGRNPVITDNDLAGEIATFHIDVRGSIKFKCEVDRSGGAAEVMGTEIGLGTDKYEYFFEGEVENGFDVRCVMASVTFTEFVKKIYVKDAIGNIDSALDELHSYAAALISGGEA